MHLESRKLKLSGISLIFEKDLVSEKVLFPEIIEILKLLMIAFSKDLVSENSASSLRVKALVLNNHEKGECELPMLLPINNKNTDCVISM